MTEHELVEPVHFIGIGGAGMSGIARIARARGARVTGSDAKESRTLDALRALGIDALAGHAAEQVAGAGCVVVSSAIRSTNPEWSAAQAAGVPILRRAEALAVLMRGYESVAVAGTHGKTTTTSLLTVALQHAGVDPSFAIGGDLNESGANAHHGSGPHFVCEADESDGSFLLLHPTVAIVTNVEMDHPDHWSDSRELDEAFVSFLHQLPETGYAVVCADDPGALTLADAAHSRGVDVRLYGTNPVSDLVVSDVQLNPRGSTSTVSWRGQPLGSLNLRIPGLHNVINAAGALAAGIGLGIDPTALIEGMASFTGTRRRFEPKGSVGDIEVFDDYAHHPTEITATLTAARRLAGDGHLVVCFQPHRYSRTEAFCEEFGRALAVADRLVVMEVYAAGEDPIPGAGGLAVAEAARRAGALDVQFVGSWSAVTPYLHSVVRPGDTVMTMGAGDVTLIGPLLLESLRESGGATVTSDTPDSP